MTLALISNVSLGHRARGMSVQSCNPCCYPTYPNCRAYPNYQAYPNRPAYPNCPTYPSGSVPEPCRSISVSFGPAPTAPKPRPQPKPPPKKQKKTVLRATPMRCWFSLRAPPDVLASSPQWARSKPPTCKSPTHTLYRRFAYYTRKRPIAARQTRLRIPSGLTKHRVTLRPNRGQRLAPLFCTPFTGCSSVTYLAK